MKALRLAEQSVHWWRKRLLRREFFEGKRSPRLRLWMARTLLDAIEVRLYREDLERVRRLADERERWARTIERVDQEVIANVVLWRVYE